jgi:hypothetical protein
VPKEEVKPVMPRRAVLARRGQSGQVFLKPLIATPRYIHIEYGYAASGTSWHCDQIINTPRTRPPRCDFYGIGRGPLPPTHNRLLVEFWIVGLIVAWENRHALGRDGQRAGADF